MRVFDSESFRGLAAYFSSLVHDSARGDPLTAARHQSFIASHLLGGLLALCVFPIYLGVDGRPSLYGAAAFLWLLSPIGIAIFVSRTGNLLPRISPRPRISPALSLIALGSPAA